MMLRHVGLDAHANKIAHAVYTLLQEGKVRRLLAHAFFLRSLVRPDLASRRQIRTPDIGGTSKTSEVTHAIIKSL